MAPPRPTLPHDLPTRSRRVGCGIKMSPDAHKAEDRALDAIKRELRGLSPEDALAVIDELMRYSLPRMKPQFQDAIDEASDVIGKGFPVVIVPGAPANVGGFVDASGKPFFFTTEPAKATA